MNRAIPLAVVIMAVASAPSLACMSCGDGGPDCPCYPTHGGNGDQPTRQHNNNGGGSTSNNPGGGGGGGGNNPGGGGGGGSAPEPGPTSGSSPSNGPTPGMGSVPSAGGNTVSGNNPGSVTGSSPNANTGGAGLKSGASGPGATKLQGVAGAKGGHGGKASFGGAAAAAAPPQGSFNTGSGQSARVAGVNADWSPTDLDKLRNFGSGGGQAEPGADQQQGQVAQHAAAVGLPPSQDALLGDRVRDLSSPAQTPSSFGGAAELLASSANKLKMGDAADALRDALKAIDAEPNNPACYLAAADAYLQLGQYSDAERMAREAIRLDPKNVRAWKTLSYALLKQGKYKDALDAALQATSLDPNNAEAWYLAACAAEKLGDHRAAIEYLTKAARLDARYRDELQRALAGQSIVDDEGDVASGMLHRAGSTPVAGLAAGLAAGAALGYGAFLLWQRRRRAAGRVVHTSPPTAG